MTKPVDDFVFAVMGVVKGDRNFIDVGFIMPSEESFGIGLVDHLDRYIYIYIFIISSS